MLHASHNQEKFRAKHVDVIRFVLHVLELLHQNFTQQIMCFINKFTMKQQQKQQQQHWPSPLFSAHRILPR